MNWEADFRESSNQSDHAHYAELCALFTAGELTHSEQAALSAHLGQCQSCAALLHSYRVVAKSGVALLSPAYEPPAAQEPLAMASAKARLWQRIEAEKLRRPIQLVPKRNLSQFLPKVGPLWAAAAAVFLLAAAASLGYFLGKSRNAKTAQATAIPVVAIQPVAVQSALEQRLQAQSREVERLQQELKQQAAAIAETKSQQDQLQHNSQQQGSVIAMLGSDKAALAAERDGLNRKLQETQNTLDAAQQRLQTLQEEHNRQLLRTASLQTRVDDLSASLKQAQDAAQRDEGFLASDRDIRELMGARELYIADVFDIDREGKNRKPFGRVFYTGGKSLLFYAFDLDREPGVREASTFQVWGRRGPGDKRPLSMGILYEDNATNRRWVLRFDDPKVLTEIDAVFVTVEPRGKPGPKPTGRQLLFASLRTPPNHP